jgi:pyruvate/2-oxoglutarate/acetoin dehydrogenase E1 component
MDEGRERRLRPSQVSPHCRRPGTADASTSEPRSAKHSTRLAADDRVFGERRRRGRRVRGSASTRVRAERVFDTPISELGLAGAAFGSAVTGLRPVVEIMLGDFLPLVMDSVVNQMSKYFFLTGGEVSVPVVLRSVVGGGGRFGAIHSQMPASWFMGVPGIKIVAPSTPADAKALLRGAIDDDNPVLFFEHKRLYGVEGAADGASPVIGEAAVVRAGRDVTLVSAMRGVHECLRAAETLSSHGIEAEVVDLRSLRPLDRDAVLASLQRTNRLVVVEEGPLSGGWAVSALAPAEHGLSGIDVPGGSRRRQPVPYSPRAPGADRIAAEVARLGDRRHQVGPRLWRAST